MEVFENEGTLLVLQMQVTYVTSAERPDTFERLSDVQS